MTLVTLLSRDYAKNDEPVSILFDRKGGKMVPDRASVVTAVKKYRTIGREEFFHQVHAGKEKAHYLFYENELYPLKAIWAAANKPPIPTRDFNTTEARKGMRGLGFETVVQEVAELFEEGERMLKEVTVLARSADLVAKAKKHHGLKCKVCGFEFRRFYGEIGADYIECHHLNPLSGREGVSKPTTIDEVTVLCANCHRMVHSRKPALTLDELKQCVEKTQL